MRLTAKGLDHEDHLGIRSILFLMSLHIWNYFRPE